MKFDTSFSGTPRGRSKEWERFGMIWTTEERQTLYDHFVQGCTLQQMCCSMGRPPAGVLTKLTDMQLIVYHSYSDSYELSTRAEARYGAAKQPKQSTSKEPIMAAANIETKTLIAGRDAKSMSDEEIFAFIGELEGQIAKLKLIRAQPKKLIKTIEQLDADIAKLVAYVDER